MRLIDADELKKHIRRCDDSETRATFDFVYDDDIDDMPTVCDIEQIRAEIEKPLLVERYADTESARAQAIALSWCLEIIDKYTAERR